MHAWGLSRRCKKAELLGACCALQPQQYDSWARTPPRYHMALGPIDDNVLTLHSGRRIDICKRVATRMLSKGEAAKAHISFLLIAERHNIMALLILIAR